MLKILAIGGSLREGSYTGKVLKEAIDSIEGTEVHGELIDLATLNLPFCNGGDEYPDYPDVEKLKSAAMQADAFLFCTPEYHGGMSGTMKNALDLLNERHLKGKVAGLISIHGGHRANGAVNNLRNVCRQLGIWTTPQQLMVSHAHEAFDDKDRLIRDNDRSRLKEILSQLIMAARGLQREVEPEEIF